MIISALQICQWPLPVPLLFALMQKVTKKSRRKNASTLMSDAHPAFSSNPRTRFSNRYFRSCMFHVKRSPRVAPATRYVWAESVSDHNSNNFVSSWNQFYIFQAIRDRWYLEVFWRLRLTWDEPGHQRDAVEEDVENSQIKWKGYQVEDVRSTW